MQQNLNIKFDDILWLLVRPPFSDFQPVMKIYQNIPQLAPPQLALPPSAHRLRLNPQLPVHFLSENNSPLDMTERHGLRDQPQYTLHGVLKIQCHILVLCHIFSSIKYIDRAPPI